MKVIVIEHDKYQIEGITTALKIRWPDCDCFSTNRGRDGIDLIDTTNPDLVILNLEAPDMDSLEAIKEIRRISTVPLVVLSHIKNDQATVVKALYYGADRVISKPFHTLEFLSRINALLRRTNSEKAYQENPDLGKVLLCSESIKGAKQTKEEAQC